MLICAPCDPLSFAFPRPSRRRAIRPQLDPRNQYDGYRARLVRAGDRVRLESKAGLDWTWRYPFITETARKMCQAHFAIDGEIVVLDLRGVSDFDALSSTPST
ncbi:hypothetical protein ABIF63_003494 [Bradyrhizobium japonicum]|uniref:ATP-dependent DNA ligase family profile domain-containing protein n=1 Tax=Bradyrhizobium japonicum TaxID=375 RepID=A0ABV2RR30_BRAJP